MTPETWRDIPDLEGYYQASDQGQIRSVDRHQTDTRGRRTFRRGRILKQTTRDGHPGALISVDGVTRTFSACRLVARTFLGAPPKVKTPRVIHIDGDPANNRVANLRWGTQTEIRIKACRETKRRSSPDKPAL